MVMNDRVVDEHQRICSRILLSRYQNREPIVETTYEARELSTFEQQLSENCQNAMSSNISCKIPFVLS